jgi:hypothetical protein
VTPQVLVQLTADGPALPVRDLAWEFTAPCGCTTGVLDADASGVDRDVAWQEFEPKAAKRQQYEGTGYRFELAVRAEVCERIRQRCPHPPRTPQRVQRRRTRGEPGMPPGAIYVGRGSRWGNPVHVGPNIDRAEAVRRYRELIASDRDPNLVARARRDLAGRDLACWCPLDQPCHADVLLQLANGPAPAADR